MKLSEILNERGPEPEEATTTATLYVNRPVRNTSEIADWARTVGFGTVLDDLHVTICFSKEELDWKKTGGPDENELTIPAGERTVMPLGDQGAVVLKFESDDLQKRWKHFCDCGASWDFEEYNPHMTITYDPGGVDLDAVAAFPGSLVLGPEEFKEVNLDWANNIKETGTEEEGPDDDGQH